MAKLRLVHRCASCGASQPKWSGRCSSCGDWNSLVEDVVADRPDRSVVGAAADRGPVAIRDVDLDAARPVTTGVGEVDCVLSGGLVPGSTTLLGGEPGIGKSTLLLQVAAAFPGTVLYVCAEESVQQVRSRAERVGALRAGLHLLADSSLPRIVAAAASMAPDLLIVDSIQAIADPELGSGPGSVAQVRGCAQLLVDDAKRAGMSTIIVGHVTKEGALAGPRALEHVVDTVLSFEGDRHHALRMLRAVKHRFGTTAELGLFSMESEGLRSVADPGQLFLADRCVGVPGSVVVPVVEGQRPLLIEVQALVVPSGLAMARRSAQGVDHGRLALLLAVMDQRADLSLAGSDVYVSVVGGIKLGEPGADLGVCVAIASAVTSTVVAPHVVVCGEVGLGGELRQTPLTARRLAEAARLGFRTAIVPSSAALDHPGIDVFPVASLAGALAVLGIDDRTPRRSRPAGDPLSKRAGSSRTATHEELTVHA
jgi:DNA repair protein RadA/Sms